jgi:hypothetical protein
MRHVSCGQELLQTLDMAILMLGAKMFGLTALSMSGGLVPFPRGWNLITFAGIEIVLT